MSTTYESLPVSSKANRVNRKAAKRRLIAGKVQSTTVVISINLCLFVLYSLGSLFLGESEFNVAIKRWLIILAVHIASNLILAMLSGFWSRGRKFTISAGLLVLLAIASGGEAALRALGL